MRQQKLSKSNPNLAVAHGSLDFFHYLQERPSERFPRSEAHINMLDKACACYRPQNIEAKWVHAIGDGQLFITKTQTAADWSWHRTTVNSSLARPATFGHPIGENHLMGIRCPFYKSPSLSTAYRVGVQHGSMLEHTVYSCGDGRPRLILVVRTAGQSERPDRRLLCGGIRSPFYENQPEETANMLLYHSPSSITANQLIFPMKRDKRIGCRDRLGRKRLPNFPDEHLSGNWLLLLFLLEHKTEWTLDAILANVQLDRLSRNTVLELLRKWIAGFPDVEIESLPHTASPAANSVESHPDASPSAGVSAVYGASDFVSNNFNH